MSRLYQELNERERKILTLLQIFKTWSKIHEPVEVEFVVDTVVDVVLLTIVGVETVVVDVVTLTVVVVETGVIVVAVVDDNVVAVVIFVVADVLPTIPAVRLSLWCTTHTLAWAYVVSKQAVADSCGEQVHVEHNDDDSF